MRPLHVLGGELGKMLADDGGAGEAELADDRRGEQVAADFVGHAEHRLGDLLGQSGIEQALQHAERRSGSFLGALEDYRTASGDRRAELAPGGAKREVPRGEGGHRSDRLVANGRASFGTDQLAAISAKHLAGVEVEQADVHHHFDAAFRERLALLHRGDAGEVFLAFDHQPRRALEHSRAFLRGRPAPDAKAFGRDFERPVEIGRFGQRHRADCFTGDRVDHVEGPPAAAGDLPRRR